MTLHARGTWAVLFLGEGAGPFIGDPDDDPFSSGNGRDTTIPSLPIGPPSEYAIVQRPFPRNFFLKNNWDKNPAIELFRWHLARGSGTSNTPAVPDEQAKRSPAPSTATAEDTAGLQLSIMSPLDNLREKMLLSLANRRYQMRTRLEKNNAKYLAENG
ncbi:hypothetical protein BV898_09708 [Hypsibius exemplaris]|nr:hypothetical protein BV898_09708 [Hypsibius exemplaris]